ncbi:6,7-dimethyl-8-ribityllumazine synthase [Marinihelvus fidelis]|uniref:6,7-dimethyl-8-ribityllumazine synthase n=1 Tax=Marinihelvus fidelis TaxID=2613842 RepID=A0A5N0T7J6_9GAMM|nr:6,7-dimethyl-8-ribityllumazine synthase [Marinihelvus fidelis]KAA9130751.1 6,7-dimethyl-8-ribityllumazine synthase [Marinihelvus fidelis]
MAIRELAPRRPGRGIRIGIAAAEFNRFITDQLLEGALDALRRAGVDDDAITLAWVPGAYELPLAADRLLAAGCDGVVTLGAVIRGGTPHFDYVAGECASGCMRVGLDHGKPVVFGVLTTDTIEQALERAAVDEGNKGYDVTNGLLQMIALVDELTPGEGGNE